MSTRPSQLFRAENMRAGWKAAVTQGLNLEMMPGERVGIVGPNGVGKSTLLAALCGRARVFSGRLEKRPGLRVAWQPQEVPAVMGLPLCGRDMLALTDASTTSLPAWLDGRLDDRLDRLSGGQRHYLALWAVLQSPADLLLLDEPTNNLDQAGVSHLAEILSRRAAEGLGVLVVSHDAAFVDTVCDRVIVMEAT